MSLKLVPLHLRIFLYIASILVLPANVLYRIYRRILKLTANTFREPATNESHARKRRMVQEQVRQWNEGGRKRKMCTGRSKTDSVMVKMPNYRDTLHNIHVEDLKDVLCVDVERKVVRVEPLITVVDLVDALLPLGWTLPVVPEAEWATVGGLIMGLGLETSSHNAGVFAAICASYELVVASGETIICSKDQNYDLYKALPSSYGTFGFLTAVELEIVEAKKFVKLEYHAAYTSEAGMSLLMDNVNDGANNNFVEGMAFSKNRWVVMVGRMVNSAEPGKINEMGWWYKPWFFKHVETFLDTGYGREYIPLRDYYFRHSKCLFWVIRPFLPFANNYIFRHLFGWTLTVDFRLMKLITGNRIASMIFAQDLFVPPAAVCDTIDAYERYTGIWPIWLCPAKMTEAELSLGMGKWAEKGATTTMSIDVATWGIPQSENICVASSTKKVMDVVLKHKGFQLLYGDVFMTRDEIGEMLDLDHYRAMRKKFEAEAAFPDMPTKVSVKARVEGIK